MMKFFKLYILGLAMIFGPAQAQQSVNTTGGNASGSGGSVSYTVGQVVYTYHSSVSGQMNQGVQQVFSTCETVEGIDVIQSCAPITWIDGNTYSTNNNTATHLIVGGAANGCDSLVTLNLTMWTCIQLQNSDCGATNVLMDQVIGATQVQGHAGYRFRITGNNNGGAGWNGNTFILDRPVRNFKFSHIPGIIWGETYSVEVAYAFIAGEYGPFGAPCNVTITGQLPTTQLQSSQCNITDVSQSTFIFANQVSNAAGYRFRIIGANNGFQGWTGNTFILDRPTRDFKFSQVPGVIWGETYSVEVAVLSADNATYGSYGTPCNVTLQSIPTTTLQSIQCGITNVTQNTALFANTVNGVIGYRFKVIGANNGAPGWVVDTYILDRPVRNFKFNMIPGVLPGEEYEVQVAVLNADGNYSAYGASCTITLAGTPDFVINDDNNTFLNDKTMNVVEFGASASHNPFTTDFGIQVLDANDIETINVSIYDMSGKLIESNTVNPMNIESSRFGKNLAAGMYMITVVQGSNQAIIRQVKN